MQVHRLPREAVEEIDAALEEHRRAWEHLKHVRETFERTDQLDEAMLEHKRIWLKLDHTIDDKVQAHSFLHYKDPDIQRVRELCGRIQVKLSKLEGDAKGPAVSMVEQGLDALVAKL